MYVLIDFPKSRHEDHSFLGGVRFVFPTSYTFLEFVFVLDGPLESVKSKVYSICSKFRQQS